MKIGYLQFKPEFADPESNISHISKSLKDKEFVLIVLPELANSGYFFSSFDELRKASEIIPDGPFCTSLKKISFEKKGYIVSGICEREGNIYYNSSVLVFPDGKIVVYRKIQLFMEEKHWFRPGNIPLQIYEIEKENLPVTKIAMMICFDWIFPEVARTLALKGAQVLCHPANLVMPYCQDAMVTRAVENRVFTITCNRIGSEFSKGRELCFTGMSEIVDPHGTILYRGSKDEEECVILDVNPAEALDKKINPMNNLFEDRREDYYFK
jgi:predicted amidohydrolase